MSKTIPFILTALSLASMASGQVVHERASGQVVHESSHYANPGIIAERGGKWVGSDHLYNLTNHIPVQAEIFKPESVSVSLTDTMIQSRIEAIFKQANILPTSSDQAVGKPPLPFFHALVIIYPIQGGFVAFCEGRLFEKVMVDRVRLDENTAMQAVTWESQNLIIAPKDDLDGQVGKSIDEIANTFVERFRFYENIRNQIKK